MLKKHKKIYFFVKILALFTALFLFLLFLAILPFQQKIYPNTYIAGIYLGDKTKDDALKILMADARLPEAIILEINNTQNVIKTTEFVDKIDFQKSVDRAYNFSNSGNFLYDLKTKAVLIIRPKNLNLVISINDSKLRETIKILSDKFGKSPKEPSIKLENNNIVVNPGENGVEIDFLSTKFDINNNLSLLKDAPIKVNLIERSSKLTDSQVQNYKKRAEKFINKSILANLEDNNIEIKADKLIQFIDSKQKNYREDKINQEILLIAKKINRSPQDSVFIVENDVVKEFVPSKDGLTIQELEFRHKLIESLSTLENTDQAALTITIPVIKLEPKIKIEDVNNLGIKTLLGRGVSYFKGSIPNRIYNINHASNKFKGILIPPGEIFSFNKILGDVSSLTGYKAAFVIKDGKTVLGDGGGVCQVSTTLFRTVLNAGLPIVERRPHSYRVGYYEQGFPPGLDATIFYPTTDFKFKNDTPNYILIQPTVDTKNTTMTFEIYGTSDGRVASISKPQITSSIAPPPDLYIDDPTLPAGQVKQIEHRAYGARVVFDYRVEKEGKILIDQQFISNYRPWQAVYLRGVVQ